MYKKKMKSYETLEDAVGESLYRQHIQEIESLDDWDKLMLQHFGLEGYKELLEAREKRETKRLLIIMGVVMLAVIGTIGAIVIRLQL